MSLRQPLPADFVERWKSATTIQELRAHYRGDDHKLRRWCDEAGIEFSKSRAALPDGFVEAHTAGATDRDLETRFALTRKQVWHRRKRAGLPINRLNAAKHGSAAMYGRNGCRCDECRQDNTRRHVQLRDRRYAITQANGGIAPAAKHNAQTYGNWGCRCDDCSTSKRIANHLAHARRSAA